MGGRGLEDDNISGIFDHYLIDDASELDEAMVSVGEVDRTWSQTEDVTIVIPSVPLPLFRPPSPSTPPPFFC